VRRCRIVFIEETFEEFNHSVGILRPFATAAIGLDLLCVLSGESHLIQGWSLNRRRSQRLLIAGVAGAFTSPTTAAGTYTFNGGTGRFANAAGSAVFAASTDGDLVSVEFTGAISPVGANLLSL
jgi:hypothetical protein